MDKKNIYLTSKNIIKINATKNFLSDKYNLICIESDSGIKGGQPYGLDETLLGCKNRTKQFKDNQNYISIENGFVRLKNNKIFDIAVIIVKIDNNFIIEWSVKRYFPIEILNITDMNTRNKTLEKHFSDNQQTRFFQLTETFNKIKEIFTP